MSHFFTAGSELRDLLVPYFKAGLENNERCLWVTSTAFSAEEARAALRAVVPDLDQRERDGQIEVADAGQWYAAGAKLRPDDLIAGLLEREQDALAHGYAGLRTNGNCSWVSPEQWGDFLEYESLVQEAVRGRRMICMCSYCHDGLRDGSRLQIMDRHDMAVSSPRTGRPLLDSSASAFQLLSIPEPISVEPGALGQEAMERRQRTFDLAMMASRMGTWRYTLADNICIYDENAQRLYGLTEARFLHDEEGVKAKFHPDDMELMWSRVGKALDPLGDGRYDVEYRVKQRDGSWRWLSAWGLVEFEGEGSQRKPVAIAGASRDLTELKQAEELQRLLLNELNHRAKNTFATIQAIAAQTLRVARDLPSAREALDQRIYSLAQAHDLLSARDWTGANLTDVVTRTVDAFTPARMTMSGPGIEVSPKHALALSLALHELATNATKYGALSCAEGIVAVQWSDKQGALRLDWQESGGPAVAIPTRKGFGSRLLEHLVARDLGGTVSLDYAPSGLRCSITAAL